MSCPFLHSIGYLCSRFIWSVEKERMIRGREGRGYPRHHVFPRENEWKGDRQRSTLRLPRDRLGDPFSDTLCNNWTQSGHPATIQPAVVTVY